MYLQLTKFLAAIIFLLCNATAARADVQIVGDSSVAVIVIPENAFPDEAVAAERFQHYVSRITGTTLAIEKDANYMPSTGQAAIYIGNTSQSADVLADLQKRKAPREASLIVARGDEVFITGVDPIGTLHATYFLLEDFGCRWYIPTEWGTVVPTLAELAVKDQSTYRAPSLSLRGGLPVTGPKIDEDANWLINEWARGNHQGGDRLWGKGHSYRFLIPVENFAEHPEWFALVDGKRIPDQLCITNPEGRAFALENVRKGIAAEFGDNAPDGIWISPNDTTAIKFCQCEGCQKFVPDKADGSGKDFTEGHDRIIEYANFFANALKDEYPNARFIFMADYHSQGFPSIVKPAPNTGFWIIHWVGDQFHGQNDKTVHGQAITKWSQFRLPMYIYTYWGSHTSWSFWPIVHVLGNDLRYYQRKGVAGVYSEIHESWGAQHLNFIVYPRVMWNVNTDVEAWVQDFCEKFYGPAAKPMREYYRLLEKAAVAGGPQLRYRQTLIPVFTPAVLNSLRKQMDLAQQAIKGADPVYQQRMDFARAGFDTGDLYFQSENLMREFAKTHDATIRPRMVANMKRVIELAEDPRWAPHLVATGGYVLLDDIKKIYEQYRQGTTFAGTYSYFEDYYLGGRTFIDATEKSGFVDDLYGLSLDGKSTGTLVYHFNTTGGNFESAIGKLWVTSAPSENPVKISARTSESNDWQSVPLNGAGVNVDFDLTPIATGHRDLWLRLEIHNTGPNNAHVLHQLHLDGQVTAQPADAE